MDATTPPPSDDEIADLAAGDLSPVEAAALRARAAADPALAERVREAERIEARLRSDGLLPVPVALVGRVLDAVRREPAPWAAPAAARPARRALRVAAAALLLGVGAWTAIGGVAPVAAVAESLAQPPLPALVRAPLVLFPEALPEALPEVLPPPAAAAIPWPRLALDVPATGAAATLFEAPAAMTALALVALLGGVVAARRPRRAPAP